MTEPIDALAFAKERQAKLDTEHTNLQQQFARTQQFLNELGGKIALVQGRIAENADTLTALSPAVE